MVRSDLRFLAFKVPNGVRDGEGLKLPKGARLIARSRADGSVLADDTTRLEEGDEIVLLVEVKEVDGLRNRFSTVPNNDEHAGSSSR